MAGALKHKQRSQYSYHDHKPYHQFHVQLEDCTDVLVIA